MDEAQAPIVPPRATPTVDFTNYPGITPETKRWLFLEHMVRKHKWETGAELGIWKGRTFFHLLSNFPNLKMIGVDLWAPQPDNPFGGCNDWPHQKNEQLVRAAVKRFSQRATIHKMYTDDAAALVDDSSLDFIFIDADHGTDAVRKDIKNWAPKVKDTGMILGHDINWSTVRNSVDDSFHSFEIGPASVWFTSKSQYTPTTP